MDHTLVLDGLIVTALVSVAVILLAAATLRRRSHGNSVRVSALSGTPAAVPTSSATQRATAGLGPDYFEVAGLAAAAPGPLPPASSAGLTAATVQNGHARPNSAIPADPSGHWNLPLQDDPRAEPAIRAFAPGPGRETEGDAADEPRVDPATGLASRWAWDEVFRHEEHRFARYGRPVTLLVAELEGLDSLGSLLGPEAADRLILPVAAAMRRSARIADFLARVGHARFAALLPETDEMAALSYAERVRSACDMWLESGRVGVHLAVGWAQPVAGGRLSDAMHVADERLNADRHRPKPRTQPSMPAQLSTEAESATDASRQSSREGGWTTPDLSQPR